MTKKKSFITFVPPRKKDNNFREKSFLKLSKKNSASLCHDTQHNDTQQNDIQQNDAQHNDTHHNGIQINGTQHNQTTYTA
jgi:hypothetical protein